MIARPLQKCAAFVPLPPSSTLRYASSCAQPRKRLELYPVTPVLPVPNHVTAPAYVTGTPDVKSGVIRDIIHTPETLDKMRKACAVAARMREFAGSLVAVGVTPDEIDKATHSKVVKNGAYPSTLNFPTGPSARFPKSLCASVNEVQLHGVPDLRPLEDGDIISLDCCAFINGFHGDCCGTFLVGSVDDTAKNLFATTQEALAKAISVCGPGVPFHEIGRVISDIVFREGFNIVRNYCGHGVGHHLHMDPLVLHHVSTLPGLYTDASTGRAPVMEKGMTFTIEPIVTEYGHENFIGSDGHSVISRDFGRAAQIEETVLVTEDGAEILTNPSDDAWQDSWGPWI